ncbi:PLAT domain-containing protein 2-like [Mercurialis annua]|uniref:PLAT domain-containing protein 2-like n=1 Tax=Mercurialis annua TaxID=3986 RepID=UPI002160298F|nr:PLAT domain-containing protein 2-like [Mercurialis annua]
MAIASYILSFLICLTFSTIVLSNSCSYLLSVKTGTQFGAGTDAKVQIKLSTLHDMPIYILDPESYGIMGEGHDYFERGNLDFFNITGPCFDTPICFINLSQNGIGDFSDWYVSYVEIEASGGKKRHPKKYFDVEQWLGNGDRVSTCREICPWISATLPPVDAAAM